MKKHLLSIAVLSLLAAAASPATAQEDYQPSPEIVQSQEQFRENRFGIFIHWGIYSMYGQGEWALNYNGLTHEEYSKMAGGFYPADLLSRRFRRSRMGECHQSLRSQVHLHHYPSPRRLLDVRQQMH